MSGVLGWETKRDKIRWDLLAQGQQCSRRLLSAPPPPRPPRAWRGLLAHAQHNTHWDTVVEPQPQALAPGRQWSISAPAVIAAEAPARRYISRHHLKSSETKRGFFQARFRLFRALGLWKYLFRSQCTRSSQVTEILVRLSLCRALLIPLLHAAQTLSPAESPSTTGGAFQGVSEDASPSPNCRDLVVAGLLGCCRLS